jgi:hypothetical protein
MWLLDDGFREPRDNAQVAMIFSGLPKRIQLMAEKSLL